MPYFFGLELTTPQTGPQQRERDLRMGQFVARLSFRRNARLRRQLRKQLEPDSIDARPTATPSTVATVQVECVAICSH
ncbi:hypothetical protein [Dactylosporangium sp. NPDC048998]|uniref:hypothetical protein n=1 Tax=Dactylosporangium sp. NPDC048998 TaxID=3363976 RepID=UPI00372130D3